MPATLTRPKKTARPTKPTARTYKATPGAGFDDADAELIGRRLEQLGKVTPQAVVADARPTSSPLHKHFEWDDSAAAEAYRLEQARNLINHLVVVEARPGGRETKAFHNVLVTSAEDGPRERVYVHVDDVRSDRGLAEQVISRAGAELRAWKGRYESYRREFRQVFEAIDELFAD